LAEDLQKKLVVHQLEVERDRAEMGENQQRPVGSSSDHPSLAAVDGTIPLGSGPIGTGAAVQKAPNLAVLEGAAWSAQMTWKDRCCHCMLKASGCRWMHLNTWNICWIATALEAVAVASEPG